MKIDKHVFGTIADKDIFEYTITNANDLSVSIISYGAIITKISMPDRNNNIEEITVNMQTLDEIVHSRPFHGGIIGPVAGRVSKGHYTDNGRLVKLDQNENNNTLHGGFKGLDTIVWDTAVEEQADKITLKMTTQLSDGTGGFPGNLKVTVLYSVNEDNEFTIHYQASTDKRTLFNPTNHIYFNLAGDRKENILNHELQVESDYFAVLDQENIPTGELRSVEGTSFDLRDGVNLGQVIQSSDEQIKARNGLDHPFCLKQSNEGKKATIRHNQSGREVDLYTDAEAVVIYTHNEIQAAELGQDSDILEHEGLTLETQTLPDAVNQENFGSIWLDPEEEFASTTVFQFKVFH